MSLMPMLPPCPKWPLLHQVSPCWRLAGRAAPPAVCCTCSGMLRPPTPCTRTTRQRRASTSQTTWWEQPRQGLPEQFCSPLRFFCSDKSLSAPILLADSSLCHWSWGIKTLVDWLYWQSQLLLCSANNGSLALTHCFLTAALLIISTPVFLILLSFSLLLGCSFCQIILFHSSPNPSGESLLQQKLL